MSMTNFDATSTAEQVTEGQDLKGKRWLITGVNSGLGYESARVLALRGAEIVGAARTREKAADALARLGIQGEPVTCELSDPGSVRAAVAQLQEGAPLDGILANAGIMALPELRQAHGYELQFFTNHIGHFILVTGLLDRLAPSARVVVLSSAAHMIARDSGLELDNLSGARDYHPWRMYGRSKLANVMFARALAKRLDAAGLGQTANSLHPGVIQTNLSRHVPDPDALFARMRDRMKTVPQGAATQCLVAAHPALAGVNGAYFSDCRQVDPAPVALDEALVEQLWAESDRIVASV